MEYLKVAKNKLICISVWIWERQDKLDVEILQMLSNNYKIININRICIGLITEIWFTKNE